MIAICLAAQASPLSFGTAEPEPANYTTRWVNGKPLRQRALHPLRFDQFAKLRKSAEQAAEPVDEWTETCYTEGEFRRESPSCLDR